MSKTWKSTRTLWEEPGVRFTNIGSHSIFHGGEYSVGLLCSCHIPSLGEYPAPRQAQP